MTDFDPAREAAALSPIERSYLLATPRQIPSGSCLIAYQAGDRLGSHRFAGFARRQAWLFTRMANSYGTAFEYRLSVDGALVADAALALATPPSPSPDMDKDMIDG